MVRKPENYPYRSHRAYLGLEAARIVDVDSVLRHFGAKKKVAREHFAQFVRAGIKLGHREEFYCAGEGRILGSEEFVDETIHRIGETRPSRKLGDQNHPRGLFDAEALVNAVETVCRLDRAEFCGPGKKAAVVAAKEALIVVGHNAGAKMKVLSYVQQDISLGGTKIWDPAWAKVDVATVRSNRSAAIAAGLKNDAWYSKNCGTRKLVE